LCLHDDPIEQQGTEHHPCHLSSASLGDVFCQKIPQTLKTKVNFLQQNNIKNTVCLLCLLRLPDWDRFCPKRVLDPLSTWPVPKGEGK